MKTAPMDCCYGSPLRSPKLFPGLRLAPLTLPRSRRVLKRGICEAILYTNAKRPASNCVCWASPPRRVAACAVHNWQVQHEPADLRILLESALVSHNCAAAAQPALDFFGAEQPFGRHRTRKTRQTTQRRREGAPMIKRLSHLFPLLAVILARCCNRETSAPIRRALPI